MMHQCVVDKLMDMSSRQASVIAESWYISLSTNPRTSGFLVVPKAACIQQAVAIYDSIAEMYFAEDCYKAVKKTLDNSGFVNTFYLRGVPLEEVLYALILLRRHIWLRADNQLIFDLSDVDMALAVDSVNRVLLVFDYATYYTAKAYCELTRRSLRDSSFEMLNAK